MFSFARTLVKPNRFNPPANSPCTIFHTQNTTLNTNDYRKFQQAFRFLIHVDVQQKGKYFRNLVHLRQCLLDLCDIEE